jgi:hypothetical protein
LRDQGIKIIWLNWGLTDHELTTIPPALVRSFMKSGTGGFGSPLPAPFGRLLMRGEYNSDLYEPLQEAYLKGKEAGTDIWIHKNRYYLLENMPLPPPLTFSSQNERIVGIPNCSGSISQRERPIHAPLCRCECRPGVNRPLNHPGIPSLVGNTGQQCVLGTLMDAYFRGYDCILLKDITATTSPDGALDSVLYNSGRVGTSIFIYMSTAC